jgi:hypothetical protein
LREKLAGELNLHTNQNFEKFINKVDGNFNDLLKGIEKQNYNTITNFKPNTTLPESYNTVGD